MTVTKEQLAAVKNGKPVRKRAARKKTKKKPVRTKSANGATLRIDRGRFCKELIKNGMNASAAYRAVSPKATARTAGQQGFVLLKEPETIAILTPMLAKLFRDAGIEADYVFRRWLEMSQATPYDYFTVDDEGVTKLRPESELTPAQRLNVRKLKVTVNETQNKKGDRLYITTRTELETVDQQRAVSEIAKHLGLLVDKLADEDVERIGDMIEKGVARIKANKDLDAWKELIEEAEFTEAG